MVKVVGETADVLQAIQEHTLEERCKDEILRTVQEHQQDIDALLRKAPFQAPELNYEGTVSIYIMEYLIPILKEHAVDPLEGRNLGRRIYQAIGGKSPVFYEIKGQKE